MAVLWAGVSMWLEMSCTMNLKEGNCYVESVQRLSPLRDGEKATCASVTDTWPFPPPMSPLSHSSTTPNERHLGVG